MIFQTGAATEGLPYRLAWQFVRLTLGLLSALAKEFLQRGVHVNLVVYSDPDKSVLVLEPVLEDREQGAGRPAVTGRSLLADLAIAEQVASLNQLIRQSHRFVVVGVVV